MIRPLIFIAALLAPAVASAQPSPLPPASAAPGAPAPSTVSGDAGGQGGYARTPATPEMRKARQAMTQACSADFAKFCADTPAGGGGRMQCIRAHRTELSDGCTQSMQAMRDARGSAPPQG